MNVYEVIIDRSSSNAVEAARFEVTANGSLVFYDAHDRAFFAFAVGGWSSVTLKAAAS